MTNSVRNKENTVSSQGKSVSQVHSVACEQPLNADIHFATVCCKLVPLMSPEGRFI